MTMSPATIFFLLLGFFSGPGRPPSLRFMPGRGFEAGLPPAVLSEREVHSQLKSGLTSTFQILVTTQTRSGAILRGGARISIRYELWDEVFLISILEADGATRRFEITDLEAFRDWWSKNGILVLFFTEDPGLIGEPVKFVLEFIPFSQDEQSNARAWFTESTGRRVSDRRNPRSGSTPELSAQTSIFQTIMATSIKRKPMVRYQWRISVERSPATEAQR